MADTELLPCPFCGGSDAFVERLDYTAAYVQCDADVGGGCACLARGPIAAQDDDGEDIPGGAGAIAAWNRRATPPSPSTEPELGDLLTYPSPHGTLVRLADVKCRIASASRGALASRPAEVGDEGLPVMPKPAGIVEYAVPVDQTMHIANAYTADQYRQGQRDAVAADRARRGGRQ